MKKILTILALFVGAFAFAQVNYVGSGTTVQINGLSIPNGRSALIYDSTLSQYGFKNSAGTWLNLITGQSIDTFSEIQAIVADDVLLSDGNTATLTNKTIDASSNTITNIGQAEIETDGVGEAEIATGAVNTAEIATAAVTIAEIATGAVASDEILDGQIDEIDLDASVNASLDLADSAIQNNDDPIFGTLTTNSQTNLGNLILGNDAGERDWLISRQATTNDFLFNWETGVNTGLFSNVYTLDGDGDPTDATDLTDKAYVDAQVSGVTQESTTVSDTAEIDLTLSGADISGALVAGSIDETKLDASVNASLDLADSASQTDDQTAAEVSIADAGALITATDVEGALQENRTAIDLNTAKTTNATHTGEVTGSGALTIANGVIEYANLELTNTATDGHFLSIDTATGGFTSEAISTTDSGSGYTFNTISTDDYYFTENQVTASGTATGKKIWNRNTVTADSLWIAKDSLDLTGNPFIIQNWGADSTVVRRGANVNFYVADSSSVLTSDGIIIKQRHPVTFIQTASSTTDDFFIQGNFTTYVASAAVSTPTIISQTQSTTEGNASATLSVDKPTGATSGRVAIIFAATDDAGSAQYDDVTNKPSGFTLIQYADNGAGGTHTAAWYRVLDGTEGSTFTVTAATADQQAAACIVLDNVNTSDVVDVTGTSYTASTGTSHALAGITTTLDNSLAFYVISADGDDTAPYSISGTGWTEQAEVISAAPGSGRIGIAWGTKDMTTQGATGDATVGFTLADGASGYTFSINGN